MPQKRASPQEANTLQLIGGIEDLAQLWTILGVSASLPPSGSRASLNSDSTKRKATSELSEEEVASTDGEPDTQRRHLWTKDILIDINSNGRFLVLTSRKDIVTFSSKFKGDKLMFTKEWTGSLTDITSGEELTCCLALPLRSQHKSSDGLPDWTCMVFGFKSGYVGFHTERGFPVHRQQFHLEGVVKLKLRSAPTCGSGREDLRDQQELVILYEGGVLVIISGPDLYSSLQTFKQQAASAASKGSEEDELILTQSIPHEKFHCDSKQSISDIMSLGVSRCSGFDQLLNASLLGGRTATIKPPIPTFRRFVVVGSAPLCASYFVMEGESSLVLGQVARAVAAKVTDAVTSRIAATANRFGIQNFWPSGKQVEKRQRTLPKTATSVEPRHSIFDARREATSIVLSATNRMAALTDNFGRVLLLDCASGVIVRMWKGYRSAEVAWMTLVDSRSIELPRRSVECLIIHAPRRQLLEVWTSLSGRRLAALKVNQGLRLLPLGADITSGRDQLERGSTGQHSQCYFFDTTGSLYTLNIPFYLVEEGGDDESGHDAEILQELKELIMTGRSAGRKSKTVSEMINSIQSYEVKDQAFEFLLSHLSGKIIPTTIAAALRIEIDQISSISPDELVESTRLTQRTWSENLFLINWLETLKTDQNAPSDCVEEDAEDLIDPAMQDLSSGTLFPLIDAVTAAQQAPDSQSPDLKLSLRQFLDFFERLPESGNEEMIFQFDEEVSSDQRLQFGLLIFSPYFQRKITFAQLKSSLDKLVRREVTNLLLIVWLDRNESLGGCSMASLALLGRVLRHLLHELLPDAIYEFRALLQDSIRIPAALIACLAILSAGFQRPVSDADEWESICKERLEWTRLSHRLESLLSLQNFLVRFLLPGKSFSDALPVSVTDFLQRGKSSTAEYLSAWCGKGFLDIPSVAIMKAFYSADIEIKLPSIEAEDQDDRPLRFLHVPEISLDKKEMAEGLAVLRAVFPRSLTADVLLSNCCLELAVLWNKEPNDVTLLRLSLRYLSDVVNSQITHGIALVIWKTFLSDRLSICATLMEKVGKAPKERLFSKDVNMSDSSVVVFLELTHAYLGLIADAEYNRQERFHLETEDLWYDETVSSKSSTVGIAVSQPATNASLVRHHMHLVTVLHAIMFYSLKSVKPLSLFDFKAQEAFFQDLTLHPVLSIIDLDQSVIRNRNQFLSRVVAALVRSAADHCVQPDVAWMEKILEVAAYWGITGDEVRTVYVFELYSHGLDELGAEAYKTVTDKQPLIARLMHLAGMRLASLTSNTRSQTSYAKNFSTMSPTLGSWIRSMDATGLACENVDWEQCYLLVRNISHDMNRQQAQHKMCTEVLEWIKNYVLAR